MDGEGEGGGGGSPGGSTSMSMEEFDAGAANTKPDLSKIVIDGDDVPADLRGKTAKEMVAAIAGRDAALRISEQARSQAELTSQALARAGQTSVAPAPAPVVEEPKDMPAEELAQLMQTDPTRAVEVIQQQTLRKMSTMVDSRLGPVTHGAAGVAEASARAKYPEEFELFGDEIKKYADSIPNKALLGNPAAWDDLISYMRGKAGNFEKLFDHRANKGKQAAAATAQATQRDTVGFAGQPARTSPASRRGTEMDPVEREIAREMNLSDEDYVKWRNI